MHDEELSLDLVRQHPRKKPELLQRLDGGNLQPGPLRVSVTGCRCWEPQQNTKFQVLKCIKLHGLNNFAGIHLIPAWWSMCYRQASSKYSTSRWSGWQNPCWAVERVARNWREGAWSDPNQHSEKEALSFVQNHIVILGGISGANLCLELLFSQFGDQVN